MPAPYPPGHWYGAGEFVSLDEAAAKAPFVIWLPDATAIGGKLVSVELNLPDNVLAVALHYDNGHTCRELNHGSHSDHRQITQESPGSFPDFLVICSTLLHRQASDYSSASSPLTVSADWAFLSALCCFRRLLCQV